MMLSVVLPVFNEAETIEAIVAQVQKVPLEKELVIVDDASTDGTREKLRPLSRGSNVRVLYHERNQGKGAALRTGFAAVRGDIVIIQDADLEYDPRDYPKLIAPIVNGEADVVFGSRFLPGSARRVPHFWHYLVNKGLTVFSNALTNLNLTDMETCYKVFRQELLQQITLTENRFGIEPELTAKIAALRCRVFEVPIAYAGRSYSKGKKIGVKDGFRALYCILKYNLTTPRRPVPFSPSDEAAVKFPRAA